MGAQAGPIFAPRPGEQAAGRSSSIRTSRVSQFGLLSGLDLEPTANRILAHPPRRGKLEGWVSVGAEAGLDARYAFSQTVSGNLTVNPDLATIEADQEQINLTRFELTWPRRGISSLKAPRSTGSGSSSSTRGGSANRRRGQGLRQVRTLRVLGAGRSDEAGRRHRASDSASFSVVRVKNDVMKYSLVGFLAANTLGRRHERGDGGSRRPPSISPTRSTSQDSWQRATGDFKGNNVAFFLRPSIDTATFHFHVRYTQLGETFGDNANAVGFIRDDNRRELDSALEKTFWFKRGFLERIDYGSNYNIYWGLEGTLRSWQIDQGLSFDLRNKLALRAEYTEGVQAVRGGIRNRANAILPELQRARVAVGGGITYDRPVSDSSSHVSRLRILGTGLLVEFDRPRTL